MLNHFPTQTKSICLNKLKKNNVKISKSTFDNDDTTSGVLFKVQSSSKPQERVSTESSAADFSRWGADSSSIIFIIEVTEPNTWNMGGEYRRLPGHHLPSDWSHSYSQMKLNRFKALIRVQLILGFCSSDAGIYSQALVWFITCLLPVARK